MKYEYARTCLDTALSPERVNTLFLTVQNGARFDVTLFQDTKSPGWSEISFKVMTNGCWQQG